MLRLRRDDRTSVGPVRAGKRISASRGDPGSLPSGNRCLLDRRTHHGVIVVARAKEFDLLLGPSNRGAVRDWRDVLGSLRSPRMALSGVAEDSV
jgi:hypothetical protein